PLLCLAAVPAASLPLRSLLATQTPKGAAYPRVFAWLAAHTPKTDVVAYDRNVEFITYSFSDYGVSPLFGITALVKSSHPNEVDRYQVWDWLVVNGRNVGPKGCLTRRFRVKYVVVGAQRIVRDYSAQ